MSDLTPTSGNRIIAADVEDGVLTLKRYDGTSESFPMGGTGGGLETETPILNWYTSVTDLADNANQAGATEYATLYDADGSTLLSVADDDPDANGFDVGDDYIISRSGADLLHFKTAGIYLANIGASAMVGVGLRADYTDSLSTAYLVSNVIEGTQTAGGQLYIVVKEVDISVVGNLNASFSMSIYNETGGPQDLWAEAYVKRIG